VTTLITAETTILALEEVIELNRRGRLVDFESFRTQAEMSGSSRDDSAVGIKA